MERWEFEYKLNAGIDVPVSPTMSDIEIRYAIDAYLQDEVDFGAAEFDDASDYDLIENDDGTADAHIRVYATYFTEVCGRDRKHCEELAADRFEEENFGTLTQDDEFHFELYSAEQQKTMSDILTEEFQKIIVRNEMYMNPHNNILNKGFVLVRPENTDYIVYAHLNHDNKIDLTFYEAPDYENERMYSESSDYGMQKINQYCRDDDIIGSEADVSLERLGSVLNKAIGMEEYDEPRRKALENERD